MSHPSNLHQELDSRRRDAKLSVRDVWVDFFANGGTAMPAAVAEYLETGRGLGVHEHDILAQAINDHYIELGLDHPAPYAKD